jgi:SAM-dependent methyltransferase
MHPRVQRLVATVRRRVRDRVVVAARDDHKTHREDIAARYLSGSGLEIGPLNFPLRVPPGVRLTYVDRQPHDELVAEYGAMYPGAAIVAPDVVDDGERLAAFADASQDFVVANHMLEHTQDPVATIAHHLRVLRPGGVLFYALPHPHHTFDAPRERTTVAHVLADHEHGPERSRRDHYAEWSSLVQGVADEHLDGHVAQLEAADANIHFHVWEPLGFAALLAEVAERELVPPFALELLQASGHEFLVVLRRAG